MLEPYAARARTSKIINNTLIKYDTLTTSLKDHVLKGCGDTKKQFLSLEQLNFKNPNSQHKFCTQCLIFLVLLYHAELNCYFPTEIYQRFSGHLILHPHC